MEKIRFSIRINAPCKQVWQTLWEDASYRNWTRIFDENSYAVTDNWKEGSKVLFIGSNGNGMVSKVAGNKPYEYMSFEHLGEVKDGVEDVSSDKVKQWAGAHENYILKDSNGKTELTVEVDMADEFREFFMKTWPKALDEVKRLAETKNEPVVIERILDTPASRVWGALTDRDQMKQWYFDLTEFRPETGFEFQFYGVGKDGEKFLHRCKVTEVIKGKRISYTWRYDGIEGISTVTFELFEEGNKTRLKLTHRGLETFPATMKAFDRQNFVAGWTQLVGTSLPNFLENQKVKYPD